ncbi:MAG TPA: hypothetical protein VGY66_12725 [Gemmataceae bacterium]|jgi:hypothetical protein|nr:hypothetical protein [Gemmataceae bacterium]
MRIKWFLGVVCSTVCCNAIQADEARLGGGVRVQQTPAVIQIDTDLLQARINKTGYVSGVAGGEVFWTRGPARARPASAYTSWTS